VIIKVVSQPVVIPPPPEMTYTVTLSGLTGKDLDRLRTIMGRDITLPEMLVRNGEIRPDEESAYRIFMNQISSDLYRVEPR
jgi:hypothetical protein